jgi:hypothetical protein
MFNGSEMQVYAVYGGWDYEGADSAGPALYDCKSAAEACAARMKKDCNYDWVVVDLKTVHMGSAIAA